MTGNDTTSRQENRADEATKWRLRERGLTLGVALWVLAVGLLLWAAPHRVVIIVTETDPFAVTGAMLVTLGICGGIGHAAVILYAQWRRSPPEHDLLYNGGNS